MYKTNQLAVQSNGFQTQSLWIIYIKQRQYKDLNYACIQNNKLIVLFQDKKIIFPSKLKHDHICFPLNPGLTGAIVLFNTVAP